MPLRLYNLASPGEEVIGIAIKVILISTVTSTILITSNIPSYQAYPARPKQHHPPSMNPPTPQPLPKGDPTNA
jgi:hypothetical protein